MTATNAIPMTFRDTIDDLNYFIKNKTPFTDVNLDGSGVAALRNILAHNTQRLALMTKFALDEQNVSVARLRSSLISAAIIKGVHIPGRQSSVIDITIRITIVNTSDSIISSNYIFLDRGTTFKGANDASDNRTFSLIEPYRLTKISAQDNTITFEGSVLAYEGIFSTYKFKIDALTDNQRFIINDISIDSRHSKVFYYADDGETLIAEFQNVAELYSGVIMPNSNTFKIINHSEMSTEFIFAKDALFSNNVIGIQYLTTVGEDGNGVNVITSMSNHNIPTIDITSITLTINKTSGQGSDIPTLDNIRNMILNYTTSQRRIVTKDDVIAAIKTKWSAMTDVSAWTGNDNIEKTYGTVFCSAKGVKNMSIAYPIADIISTHLTSLAVDGLDVVFVQPSDILCDTFMTVIIDKQISYGINESSIINTVQTTFNSSFYKNSISFNATLDQANIITDIKKAVPQVTSIQILHTFKFNVNKYRFSFDNAISSIEIENAKYNDITIVIKNDIDGKLYAYDMTGIKILSFPVGTVDLNTGLVNIQRADLIKFNSSTAKVVAKFPTIRVFRNNFLKPNIIDVKVVYG